jgi:hypothetical protein
MRFYVLAAAVLLAAPMALAEPQANAPPKDAPKADAGTKAADAKPADVKTDPKTADAKPADVKPADVKPADAKPADTAIVKPDAKPPTAVAPPPQSLRLTDTRAKVDELTASMKRIREQLASVSNQVMSPVVGAAATDIMLRNEMSGAYRLVHATIRLDGAVLIDREDEGNTLADQKELPVLKGAVAPGDHTLSVELIFQGSGYGVFSYLKGYRYNVKSTHAFAVGQGKPVNLDITAYEKGDATTPLDQRPAIDWKDRAANKK